MSQALAASRAGYNQHHWLLLCCWLQPRPALPGRGASPRCASTALPALGSPHLPLRSRRDLGRSARVLPLLWLQGWSPGVSCVLGAAVRSTSPTEGWGELCHTPAALSILSLSG